MGSARHMLCPKYSESLTPTVTMATRLRGTLTFTLAEVCRQTTRTELLKNNNNIDHIFIKGQVYLT